MIDYMFGALNEWKIAPTLLAPPETVVTGRVKPTSLFGLSKPLISYKTPEKEKNKMTEEN